MQVWSRTGTAGMIALEQLLAVQVQHAGGETFSKEQLQDWWLSGMNLM
jgi:hypothetical protein